MEEAAQPLKAAERTGERAAKHIAASGRRGGHKAACEALSRHLRNNLKRPPGRGDKTTQASLPRTTHNINQTQPSTERLLTQKSKSIDQPTTW
jgi:hypothetical protein